MTKAILDEQVEEFSTPIQHRASKKKFFQTRNFESFHSENISKQKAHPPMELSFLLY
ncbi:hypothetical protein AF67_01475 [Streptococcus uberis 6780]|nr:hypothetical protein AF61_00360 [Streptococcus uberis EF20/0145]KKF55342.1 hypothetical protein AF67_01475 [Streptococcus uberis 6780]